MTSETYPIHFRVLSLYLNEPFNGYGSDLRRAVTAAVPEEPLLHHHKADGSFDYTSPQIRYLVLEGKPLLVSFHDGKEVAERVARSVSSLRVGKKVYAVTGYDFIEDVTHVGLLKEHVIYRSSTPWLALNQDNQRRFENAGIEEQKLLLERILIGNYLSAMKGLGVRISSRLQVQVESFHKVGVFYLPTSFVGLSVTFGSNMLLPPFLGIGKMPAKGFGLMRQLSGL